MNKPYRLVVFDWEGTIGEDTIGQVLNALDLEARRLHYAPINRQLARECIDLGLTKALGKLYPELSLSQHEHLLEAVQHALTICSMDVCLLAGAKWIVQEIAQKGLDLAIATSKGAQSLHRALQHSGLDTFFTVTRSAGQTAPKPNPQMLYELMDEFAVEANQTVMIGDSSADMEMARAAEVDAIGIDFYHLHEDELRAAGAMAVFQDYQQVARFLQLGDGV